MPYARQFREHREEELYRTRTAEFPQLPKGSVEEFVAYVLKYGKQVMQEVYDRLGVEK